MIMFFFDRWVLGRKARKAIGALEGRRDHQRAKNAALEARISVLERFSNGQTGGEHEGVRHRRVASPTGQSEAQRTRDIWSASPGAGRAAAKLLITASTLEEARDIYSGFRAASQKSDAQWQIGHSCTAWKKRDAGMKSLMWLSLLQKKIRKLLVMKKYGKQFELA